MDRRQLLRASLVTAAAWPLVRTLRPGLALAQGVDVNAILHDPDAPEAGNPKGDVTIVAFFDYNCPFCKKAEPELEAAVTKDGRIRLVYKDWPILSDASIYAAQMALAAKYQGRYQDVHGALMAIPGRKIAKDQMRQAIAGTGIDMAKLEADRDSHKQEIGSLLQRTMAQADAMGLQGTPVYLVGPLKVAQALDAKGFRDAIAQARARQAGQ
ncbi:DsbA family protein [Methylobacterium sp. C33D]